MSDLEIRVCEIVEDCTCCEDVESTSDLVADCGCDQEELIAIYAMVEDEFNVSLMEEDKQKINTVQDLIDCIKQYS